METDPVGSNLPVSGQKDKLQQAQWANPVERLMVTDISNGARTININNREIVGPLQGFGPMWQRNYRVRLSGVKVTPAELIRVWKDNFPDFQPPENHFYPPKNGVQPGEVMYIETSLPLLPGLPGLIPMKSGVMILFADDEMFTVMTPEGFPVSGWNTFSAYDEDGVTVAQVQGLVRTSDPIYEFGFRFMGGEKEEDKTWCFVLQKLAEHYGVNGQIQYYKVLIDPKIVWSQSRNVWKNAAIRSFFYILASPVRRIGSLFKSKRAS